jgi:hypothetical protein
MHYYSWELIYRYKLRILVDSSVYIHKILEANICSRKVVQSIFRFAVNRLDADRDEVLPRLIANNGLIMLVNLEKAAS